MANVIADEKERELLADIVDSPGWAVLIRRIVKPLAKQRMLDSLARVRRGDLALAQSALAASEACVEVIVSAYEGSGRDLPEEVRALRQHTDLIQAGESGSQG